MEGSGEIAQARGCEMRFGGGLDCGESDVQSRPPSQPLYSRLGLGESDSGYKEDSYSSFVLYSNSLSSCRCSRGCFGWAP